MGKQSNLYYSGVTDGFVLRAASSTCMEINKNNDAFSSRFNKKTQFCYYMPSGFISPGTFYTAVCNAQSGTVTSNSLGVSLTFAVPDYKLESDATPSLW
jgi:hypothetical protein